MSNVASTLLLFLATISKQHSILESFDIVAVCRNKVECCFDKVERSFDNVACCFDIVADVDGALSPVHTSNNVEATLSKQQATL